MGDPSPSNHSFPVRVVTLGVMMATLTLAVTLAVFQAEADVVPEDDQNRLLGD